MLLLLDIDDELAELIDAEADDEMIGASIAERTYGLADAEVIRDQGGVLGINVTPTSEFTLERIQPRYRNTMEWLRSFLRTRGQVSFARH